MTVVNAVLKSEFERDYSRAMSELGTRAKKVTFSTTALASGEDNADVELYYTAFIEYQ